MPPISDNTKIYKYISREYVNHLLVNKTLLFMQINKWPDMMEGYLQDLVFNNANSIFGSCWTLHHGLHRIVIDNELEKALKAVEENGVDAMWKMYCRDGGIRIQTTLGKIKSLLSQYCYDNNGFSFDHGPVTYEHYSSTTRDRIDKLFLSKSPNFYADDEYRFVIKPLNKLSDEKLLVPIGNVALFVDEILVSPPDVNCPDSVKISQEILYDLDRIQNPEFSYASHAGSPPLQIRRSVLYGIWPPEAK